MSELRDILREEYIRQINQLDLKKLLEMVEDVMSQPITIAEQEAPTIDGASEQETLDMVLKMIPNIEVSEIGWSDVSTVEKDGKEQVVSGPQRALLENYLNNIAGSTFQERIDNVSMFYADGAGIIGQGKDQTRAGRLTQAISYLVFYKTLTKVITNFNASSAGFSFESFLSALVEGQQIQTGNKTIADYTDNLSGEEIPVSLKLYREGGLEVGGSYTDLINDLVEPKFQFKGMRYVVCTKDLTGQDLEQEGEIKFWQFDFTLDNVMRILMNSKDKSAECIRLPQEVVNVIKAKGAERSDYSNMLGLPQKATMPSADEVYNKFFIPKFKANLMALQKNQNRLISYILRSEKEINDFLNQLNWDSNDKLFHDVIITIQHPGEEAPQEENYGAQRGRAKMNDQELINFATEWKDSLVQDTLGNPDKNPPLAALLKSGIRKNGEYTRKMEAALKGIVLDVSRAVKRANQGQSKVSAQDRKNPNYSPQKDPTAGVTSVFRASEIEAERKEMIRGILDAEGGFLSPAASAQVYDDTKNEAHKKALLKHSLGYLNTMHFSLNQKQATDSTPPGAVKYDKEDETGEDVKVQGGVSAIYLGEIKVGARYVAEAMAGVRDILNEEILEIFRALKSLSDSLNGFFAGGLQDDSLATTAVNSANNISSKEVLTAPGGGKQMSLPFDK